MVHRVFGRAPFRLEHLQLKTLNLKLRTPNFPTLNLVNNRHLEIKVNNQGDKNLYVQKVMLDGTQVCHPWLSQDQLINGTLEFYMGPKAGAGGGYECPNVSK